MPHEKAHLRERDLPRSEGALGLLSYPFYHLFR
jgi:hypothetical protein